MIVSRRRDLALTDGGTYASGGQIYFCCIPINFWNLNVDGLVDELYHIVIYLTVFYDLQSTVYPVPRLNISLLETSY